MQSSRSAMIDKSKQDSTRSQGTDWQNILRSSYDKIYLRTIVKTMWRQVM